MDWLAVQPDNLAGAIRSGTLALALGVLLFLPACGAHDNTVAVYPGNSRMSTPVRSLLDLRSASLVRQGWDISCGAAALSTILIYQFDADYTEATIVVSILKNSDPEIIRARGGFSLLDLKKFAEAVGYQARGYGDLTLDDLANFNAPAILPVRIRGYDHFLVYRGRVGNRVLVGDPAFGNLTIPVEDFLEMWPSRIGFLVLSKTGQTVLSKALAPGTLNLMVPDLNHVHRTLGAGSVLPATRRPGAGYP